MLLSRREWCRWMAATAFVIAVQGSMSALRTAAGGGPGGQNGFAEVSKYLDNLATYLMYLAIPAGVLGLIAAGGMLIAGNSEGQSWLARTALGVGIVFLAKGVMA